MPASKVVFVHIRLSIIRPPKHMRPHYHMLEIAPKDDVESLLIFEDDAVFVKDYFSIWKRFAENVPSDCERRSA